MKKRKKPLESDFMQGGYFHDGMLQKYIDALVDYIDYLENKPPPIFFQRLDGWHESKSSSLPYLDADPDVDLPPKKK